MDNVFAKSAALPENDVPPEIIRLLPQDGLLDKIEVQQNATPVPIAKSVEEAAELFETKKINCG